MPITRESPAGRAAPRVARNGAARVGADVLGKVASFVLFGAVARTLGEAELGVYVAAVAFTQVVTAPIDLGFDTHVLRTVSSDRSQLRGLFFNTIALKLVIAVPILAVAFAALQMIGYGGHTRAAVYVLAAGLMADVLAITPTVVFTAFERVDLLAVTIVVQRVGAAVLGVAALAAGLGVIAVAAAYSVAAVLGLAVALMLMAASEIGMPRFSLSPRSWPSLLKRSAPFAALDAAGLLLARIDVVILAALATTAAVGSYGAAYRLLESTSLITFAVFSACAAMYGYLGQGTEPTIAAVFSRSIKLAVALLAPCAVTFAVLAAPLIRLFFGHELGGAAAPLRLLAPAMALMGVITLASYLVVAQRGARLMLPVAAAMAALNVGLNFVLVPYLAASGAAAAMLATEAVFAPLALALAARAVGGLAWSGTLGAPLGATAAMALWMALAGLGPVTALTSGLLVYLVVLVSLERVVAPGDFAWMLSGARRLRAGATA